MTREKIASVVAKLRVKPGLVGDRLPLDKKDLLWKIGFYYDRTEKGFVAKLWRGERSSTMTLDRKYVETKGKSHWLADNTWRMTSEGVQRVVDSIMSVMGDPRAQRS